MYIFSYNCPAKSKSEGEKKSSIVIERCLEFKKAMGILLLSDLPVYCDGMYSSRIVFNVHDSQDSVLLKVSALFAFAASVKLTLINQEFLPK